MLAAKGLLNVLSVEGDEKDYKDYNNDHNFSDVLNYCGDHTAKAHIIRYANGEEKKFSFNE
ncbi:MAG: hypothetical protein HDQ99_22315 [Lachnospiraceae bacterium]|nr:hypothetical protein [Lachnospiraceae bacterium]MBD5538324.1 hypothetical protein [Lachnospiraceae bacterium]